MNDNVIAHASEEVLKKYLAPEAAHAAALEIASGVSGSLELGLSQALKSVFGANGTNGAGTNGHAKPKAPTKTPAAPAALKGPATDGEAHRGLSKKSLEVMRFKKKLHWAKKRQADKKDPIPGDAEVLAAAAEGKVISVARWSESAKKKAKAALAPKVKAKATNGHAKKAAATPKASKKAGKKKAAAAAPKAEAAPPPKASNGAHGKTTVSDSLPV